MVISPVPTRQCSIVEFDRSRAMQRGDFQQWVAVAQNFEIRWIESVRASACEVFDSACESILLCPGGSIRVSSGSASVMVEGKSVCIVPAGSFRVECLAELASCIVLRADVAADPAAMNGAMYAQRDPRIAPIGSRYRRKDGVASLRAYPIDRIEAPSDNPRLKMLQSDSMSINWVEYQGARDLTKLSPHSHANFEQASLALTGDFVHHLRTPWTSDMTQWREDQHIEVGERSVAVIPVDVIHTTAGIGDSRHLLVDIFAPVRADFRQKGWIHNASDYMEPA